MSTSEKTKESKHPGWLNLDKYDFLSSIYLIWFFTSLVIVFGGSQSLENSLQISSNHEKFIWVYGSFVVLAVSVQTILGTKKFLLSLLRLIGFPLYFIYYFSSYSLQIRKTFKRLKTNLPIRFIYFAIVPVIYTVGLGSNSLPVLSFFVILTLLHLFVALYWGIKWSLNPFDFLKHSTFLKDSNIRNKFILGIVKLDSKAEAVTVDAILEKIKVLKKAVDGYNAVIRLLSSKVTLFSCFLIVLFFVSFHIVVGSAVVLRIMHLSYLPVGLIEVNGFFTGSILDYLYISLNTFLPHDLYGIEFLSNDLRWILSFITFSSYALLVVAIAGFSMAGAGKVEDAVSDLTKDMHSALDEAASFIKGGDSSVLLGDKKNKMLPDVDVAQSSVSVKNNIEVKIQD